MNEAYDIIVIGGGHNGLVAAAELARAGYSVCVVEARQKLGGCAITIQPMLDGFFHSPHANSFLFADILPQRIAPTRLGVSLVQPDAQFGIAFANGRPPVILHRPDRLKLTQASFSVYSRSDAAKYIEIKRRSAKMGPLLREGLYTAPVPAWFDRQKQAVLKVYGSFCDRSSLGKRSAAQLIDEIFVTPEIRTLLYALAIETGVGLQDPGSDLAFLAYSLWIAGRWRIPVGGMQAYSDALSVAAQAVGARVHVGAPVQRVIVKDGQAIGIRTSDGDEIRANRAVVAAVPLLELFDNLLAPEHISATEQSELETFRRSSSPSIVTSAFCLDWEPRYKSGLHDPQIDRCLKTVIGFEDPSDVIEHATAIRARLLPRPAGVLRVHSLWDSKLAPSGHHLAAADSLFPSASSMDQATWDIVKDTFSTALFDAWQSYMIDGQDAPPMTVSFDDALGFERRMLLRFGSEQYRTSVSNLYLAGPGVYPGGGVHGACGHNAAYTATNDIKTKAIEN